MSERWKPHAYERAGVEFLIKQACAGLIWDPGLGKTSTTLAAILVLLKKHYIRRVLVIAPLRPAQSTWPGELEKWIDFKDLRMVVLHGPKKEQLLATEADIYVVNPEGLGWLFRHRWQDLGFDMLVVDESTRFKHSDTRQFKTLKQVLDRFKRRVILTGEPAPNGLLDLFGQIYILDLGNSLGRFITHYRNSYFDPAGQVTVNGRQVGYGWFPRAGSAEKIYKAISPLVMRLAAEDYLTLPPLIENTIKVEMDAKSTAIYRQMEATLITQIEDEVVTAANVAVATGKLRQIANGGLYNGIGDEREALKIHDAKTEVVEEIIEELQGKPCLVAYEFEHDLDRLRGRLGGDTPYIGGGVPTARFREIEHDWNAGRIPVLLAQPQSVAHGLNLQGTGAAVIWHSIPWDLDRYHQFVRRVWRQGQKERVVVHHVVAKGTVDETVMKALARKDKTQRALLDALKSDLKGRRAA